RRDRFSSPYTCNWPSCRALKSARDRALNPRRHRRLLEPSCQAGDACVRPAAATEKICREAPRAGARPHIEVTWSLVSAGVEPPRAVQIRVAKDSQPHDALVQVRFLQARAAQDGLLQVGPLEVGLFQIRATQICTA